MQVPKELQSAIRAAAAGHAGKSWDTKNRERKAAIQEFLKSHPKVEAALKKAKHEYDSARQKESNARSKFNAYGLRVELDGFDDEARFVRQGGKVPEDGKWSFNQIMAALIVAQPKDLHRILAKYGINWK